MEKNNEAKIEEVSKITPTILEKTMQVVKEFNEANKKREEILEREERLKAFNVLGGRSMVEPAPERKEETPKEYKNRVMTGKL